MAICPVCGLGERCRNHWVAVQEANGEMEFQIGAMTASEDNLILLRNKLGNPPLRTLFEKIALQPAWVDENGRTLAYLAWPLELRGAVHRTLFPAGAPGSERPIPPTPMFDHHLVDMRLIAVEIDTENCLPDELLFLIQYEIDLEGVGTVPFRYMQVVWAEGITWANLLNSGTTRDQAIKVIRLLYEGLIDPLRATFAGQTVTVLADEQPEGIQSGVAIDEMALAAREGVHFGEEIERLANQRRLQPMLRDSLIGLLAMGMAGGNGASRVH